MKSVPPVEGLSQDFLGLVFVNKDFPGPGGFLGAYHAKLFHRVDQPGSPGEPDLELALRAAEESGCKNVIITAALGGRLDQTLSNIFLMNLPCLSEIELRIDEGDQEVILILQSIEVTGKAGDTVSLLPLSPIVRGITTSGLKYPLIDESLVFFQSRGISNRMLSNSAKIQIQSGILLCIHTRSEVEK